MSILDCATGLVLKNIKKGIFGFLKEPIDGSDM